MTTWSWIILLGAMFVVETAQGPARGANAGVQRRSDTTVVRATAPVHPRGGTLVEDLTIGKSDGPSEYSFGRIAAIAAGPDGSIFINDQNLPAIYQYDRTGKHIRTFGRKGDGPGEYQEPTTIAFLRNGNVLVRDPGKSRINVYSPTGAPVGTWSIVRSNNGAPNSVMVTTSDIVYVRNRTVWQTNAAGDLPPTSYIRLRSNGSVIDTIAEPIVPYKPVNITNAGGHRNFPLPYGPQDYWSFSPLGYFITGVSMARGNQYSFELRIPRPSSSSALPEWRESDAVVSIRARYTPVPVKPQEAADWKTNMESLINIWDPAWRYPGPAIPSTKAPYTGIWADADGRIWVYLSGAGIEDTQVAKDPKDSWVRSRWPEVFAADVFEPTGRYLGRVSGKTGMRIHAARGDFVYAGETNADGFDVVKRYRIAWQ